MVDSRVIDTIIAEAVNGGDPGMLAVAYTIANRARKSGNTPFEVVSAPSQFEGYSNPGPGVRGSINDPDTRTRAENLWGQAYNRTVRDPTEGGTMFHASSMTPYWAKAENKHGTVEIGGQTYYLGGDPWDPSPEVPPRRPDSLTASSEIERLFGGSDAGVSGIGYAPSSGNLDASPRDVVAQALMRQTGFVRPEGPPGGLPGVEPTPRITEQILRPYAENYTFTRDRLAEAVPESGLTTRRVHSVEVDPLTGDVAPSSSGGGLAAALERLAARRRAALPGIEALPSSFEDKGPSVMYGENNVALPGTRPINAQPIDYPTIAATDPTEAIALPRGPGRRGHYTLMAPTMVADYSGSPVFGNNPALMKPMAQPELGPPDVLMAATPPLPRRRPNVMAPAQPLVAAPTPAPRLYGRPPAPEEMTNPTAQEVLAGLANGTIKRPPNEMVPPGATSAFFEGMNNPGLQMVGQMNAGQRPILSALASMFLPRQSSGSGVDTVANAMMGSSGGPFGGNNSGSSSSSSGPRDYNADLHAAQLAWLNSPPEIRLNTPPPISL